MARIIQATNARDFFRLVNTLPDDPGPNYDGKCDLFKKVTNPRGPIIAPVCRGTCATGHCRQAFTVRRQGRGVIIRVTCECS